MADEVTLPEISVDIPKPNDPSTAGKGDGPGTNTSADQLITNPGDGTGSSGTGIGFGLSNGTGNNEDLGGFAQGVNKNSNAYYLPSYTDSREAITSVAPAWRFIAIMPEISNKVGSNLSVSNTGASYSSAKKLSGSNIPIAVCESVNIPPITIDTDQRFGGGTKIYVARFISTGMITLNFYEDENYNVSKYLWAWHTSIVNSDNLFYLPKNYKKDIKVWAYDNRSNNSPAVMYDFIECLPNISASGLDYSITNNGFLTVNAEFTIDNQDTQFTR